MIKSLKNIIKKIESLILKNTLLYNYLSKKKWQIKYEYQNLLGTPSLNELIEMPHREYLVEEISKQKNFKSLLEFGCGYGPNLLLLRKKLGNGVKLSGCDISQKLIDENIKREIKRDSKINYFFGGLDWLNNGEKKLFDYVLLDSVSMYLGPNKIKDLFEGLHKVTKKKVLLTVWQKDRSEDNQIYWKSESEWLYDYSALCKNLFKIKIKKFPKYIWTDERWKKYGVILLLEPKVKS